MNIQKEDFERMRECLLLLVNYIYTPADLEERTARLKEIFGQSWVGNGYFLEELYKEEQYRHSGMDTLSA